MANLRGSEKGDRFGIWDGPTDEADTIEGLGGDDIIYGLGGNDQITGGAGADFIFGGSGFDAAFYTDSWEGVIVDLTSGSGRGGSAEGDLLISIEALVGSRFDDTLIGNAQDDYLLGGEGADHLYGLDGTDWLQGGLGADTLIGGDGANFDFADYSDSFEGVNVSLHSMVGAFGTAAGDRLFGIEALIGSIHSDTLEGSNSDNLIFAGFGNDVVLGRAGTDHLYGEDGSDFLEGGAGGDFLHGGTGFDSASYWQASGRVVASLIHPYLNAGDAAGDIYLSIENLIGSNFNDTLEGDDDSNSIFGLTGTDVLNGSGGADDLHGGDERDVLLGGSGADVLFGEDGDDVLMGDTNVTFVFPDGTTLAGVDHLYGGAGADTFVWNSVADSPGNGFDIFDLVEDFNYAEGDRLDLSWVDANTTTAFNDSFTFVGTAGPPGTGQIGCVASGGFLIFLINNDADADVDMNIHVRSTDTPTADWLFL